MGVISDIVSNYETQNRQRITGSQPRASNREDIFLKVEPRGDPVGQDKNAALGIGDVWKARKVNLYKPAKIIEAKPQKTSVLKREAPLNETEKQELERLRTENEELREKLQGLQQILA